MLMIDRGGEGRGLIFSLGFLGEMASSMQCLCHAYLQKFRKMVVRPIVVHNNFQEGFGRYTDQKTPFKR